MVLCVGEKTSTSASLSYRWSDGEFQFEDRGDRVDPSDDRETRRINNDYESVDLLLRHGRRIGPQSSLTLTSSTYYKEEGTPGRGSVQASNARFESLRSIVALGLDGPGGLRSEIDLTFGDDTQKDPKSIGPGGIIDSLGLPYERAEGTRVAVDGRVSRPLLKSDLSFRRGEPRDWGGREHVFAEHGRDAILQQTEFETMVRSRDWKLVHFLDEKFGQLFNLKDDPGENVNLWEDPRWAAKKQELLQALLNWRIRSSWRLHPNLQRINRKLQG